MAYNKYPWHSSDALSSIVMQLAILTWMPPKSQIHAIHGTYERRKISFNIPESDAQEGTRVPHTIEPDVDAAAASSVEIGLNCFNDAKLGRE